MQYETIEDDPIVTAPPRKSIYSSRPFDLIKRHGHTTPHAHNEATSDWAIRA